MIPLFQFSGALHLAFTHTPNGSAAVMVVYWLVFQSTVMKTQEKLILAPFQVQCYSMMCVKIKCIVVVFKQLFTVTGLQFICAPFSNCSNV